MDRGLKLALLALAGSAATSVMADDTVWLTDQPGGWFRSEATGTPVSVISAGERVDFKIDNCCTDTRHTVTMLVKPTASRVNIDQDDAKKGSLSLSFDAPGVYVLVCKVHPYMTCVVAVKDAAGNIPDVQAASLPFIGHLGVDSLPASAVLGVMTTVAPSDADKAAKWDIRSFSFAPSVPGVGEVWVNAQFERVPGQRTVGDEDKPGTITVVDPAIWRVEREINGRTSGGMWNNPHNMWADVTLGTVYNTNWFGRWLNKIDRTTGTIVDSIEVGEAPTHVMTVPNPASQQFGWLTVPLSADNNLVKIQDQGARLQIQSSTPTGSGRNHPHGHWITCGDGRRTVVPNVFKGFGVGGSISIVDTESGAVLREFRWRPEGITPSVTAAERLLSLLTMPLAAGECHVRGVHKAYVACAVSGQVIVVDVDRLRLTGAIPVTFAPDGRTGLDLLHTLQVPIQVPVSPDEKWAACAVFSLTTVARPPAGKPDHVAIIDTSTDTVVAIVPTPGGTHGVNWGAKLGGGYYAYVTAQHSNVLTAIDPDPNFDGRGNDARVVGELVLSNGSTGAGVTDGTGGQGIKPLPMTHDGWIQPTVALVGTGRLSAEVESWIDLLTPEQKEPAGH